MAQDPREVQGKGVASALLGRWPVPERTGSQDTGDCLSQPQPQPREEVLPGALRRCLPRYIVEQETGQRGSWAVDEGAPDAEPPARLPGQVEARPASGHPEVPGPGRTVLIWGGEEDCRWRGPHPAAPRRSGSCAVLEGGRFGKDLPLAREEVGSEGLPAVLGQ